MTAVTDTRRRGPAWERYAPLTGVLAVVFWVIGTIVRETAVEMKTPATLLDSYRTEEGSILLGGFVWLLGDMRPPSLRCRSCCRSDGIAHPVQPHGRGCALTMPA